MTEKNTPWLLASDFDRTLTGTDCKVPPRNVEAIRRFIEAGNYFTVATGRSPCLFRPAERGVPVNAPVIMVNGAALYDFEKEEAVWASPLCPETRARLTEIAARFPAQSFELYTLLEGYSIHPDKWTEKHAFLAGARAVPTTLEEQQGPWMKVLFTGERENLAQIQEYILSRWAEDYNCFFSADWLLELVNISASKGAALQALGKLLKVPADHICCAGDAENDLSMLTTAANPFAPGDCADCARETGARIVCPCDEGSIADIVELIIDN